MTRRFWCLTLVLAISVAGLGLLAVPERTAQAASTGARGWVEFVGPGFARYVPGTGQWEIALWVVGDTKGATLGQQPRVRVTIDGKTISTVRLSRGIWVAPGKATQSDLQELKAARADALRGLVPTSSKRSRIDKLTANVKDLYEAGAKAPWILAVSGTRAVPTGSHWLDVTVEFDLYGAQRSIVLTKERVQVLVATIPTEAGWFPSDLHVHSVFSDGSEDISAVAADLAAAGYAIGYMTDHVGPRDGDSLRHSGSFAGMTGTYPGACYSASSTRLSVFPGLEMKVGADDHLLAYGISGYGDSGYGDLKDKAYSDAQEGIYHVLMSSPISSSAIAHPANPKHPWNDTSVVAYDGIELMSGFQIYFDADSAPVQFWRRACAQMAAVGCSLPSVRTGSDYHRIWYPYVTQIRLPDTASMSGTWDNRREATSKAIWSGRTTVSLKGSLASLKVNGNDVGSFVSLTKKTTGKSVAVNFTVFLKPIEAGTYSLRLYRDDRAATLWTSTASLKAGQSMTGSVSSSVCGGIHYYWLYVSGPDYCYTSPITVAVQN